MNVSIVIVSYNVKDFLSACIRSIESNHQGHEIIVVDNNSADGTVESVKREFPGVKIIENLINRGFSGANNQGISSALSENILLLNPDTTIIGDALNEILKRLNQKKEFAIIAPRLLNSDMTLQMSCWHFPGVRSIFLELFFLHKLTGSGNYSKEKMKNIFNPDAVSGAAMLFTKDIVKRIGGLDENLFWMEDVDFCFRAKKAGAIIEYFPGAEIIHHAGKSSGANQKVVLTNQLLSKLKYIRKHNSGFIYFLACIIIFLHIISRVILLLFLAPFRQKYRTKLSSYFYSLQYYFKLIGGRNEIIR